MVFGETGEEGVMAKKSPIRWMWKFFESFLDIKSEYKDIKSGEDRKSNVKFGVKSILYSVLFLVLVSGGIALGYWSLTMFDSLAIIFGIILLITAIGLLFYSITYFILALVACIMQLIINRRAIGWIALAIILLIVSAVVVGLVVIIG